MTSSNCRPARVVYGEKRGQGRGGGHSPALLAVGRAAARGVRRCGYDVAVPCPRRGRSGGGAR